MNESLLTVLFHKRNRFHYVAFYCFYLINRQTHKKTNKNINNDIRNKYEGPEC